MQIERETLEVQATATLKGEKPKTWRKRYSAADLSGAVRSAARSAQEHGRDVFVISSNSYGAFVWAVSLEARDVVSLVINSGKRAYRVTPAADVFRIHLA